MGFFPLTQTFVNAGRVGLTLRSRACRWMAGVVGWFRGSLPAPQRASEQASAVLRWVCGAEVMGGGVPCPTCLVWVRMVEFY